MKTVWVDLCVLVHKSTHKKIMFYPEKKTPAAKMEAAINNPARACNWIVATLARIRLRSAKLRNTITQANTAKGINSNVIKASGGK